ncbi:metal-dependent hydrolase [Desulfotalea psychrophila]|uniref:Hypothetical membrane protein n=1 Tax=Desulfotalea psychrophila (strain LSv54 / DSM 12343) TaxID=177439 RepID=Q6AMI9_DESPS|nr:metal-dependent hydrolase [Desulfotalea psychrophila]CAG36436.1 hypothetical membrane protein [Desulfotalea psychrophila LSv54]
MANFSTHLTAGACVGFAISTLSTVSFDFSISQTATVFLLGAIGGTLPDLDSDSGKPLRFLFTSISLIIPALMLSLIQQERQPTPEFLFLYFFCSYFFINYFLYGVVKKLTVHRGILHSIPFCLLMGEMGYLLFINSGATFALIVGFSVFSGCLSHLIIDELYSISFQHGLLPRLKRSSGSALKFYSKNRPISLLTYLLLLLLSGTIYHYHPTDISAIRGFLAMP